MKLPLLYAALICTGLMTTPAHLSGQAAPPAAPAPLGPRMKFVTNEYNFGKVMAGELVKYVFIVSNAGDQTLEISRVQPGCHCTTAGDWSKAHLIEPGKTGEIPIQFDSGSFRGEVTKNITVTSNDKLAPNQTLLLRGSVWKAIEVSPQFAYINVMPDAPSNATTVVHIVNQSDEPLTLSNATSASPSFKAELKTIKPGKEFEATITAVPPLATGNNTGIISIQTSLPKMPVITVTAIAIVQPAVGVSPMQITLPSQILVWTTNLVTISGHGSKPLVLTGPETTDPRVIVTMKETLPGRIFQLAAVFPPGFQLAPGQQVDLKVKSNNAERLVIVVPIRQNLRQPVRVPLSAQPRVMSQNPPAPPSIAHP